MLKVHCEEFNCLCNWIMTDLCVQKTNQILTLGQPPQNLFNLGQFEVFITLTSLL